MHFKISLSISKANIPVEFYEHYVKFADHCGENGHVCCVESASPWEQLASNLKMMNVNVFQDNTVKTLRCSLLPSSVTVDSALVPWVLTSA